MAHAAPPFLTAQPIVILTGPAKNFPAEISYFWYHECHGKEDLYDG